MTIKQLQGIANITFNTVSTLTWSTASEWDNAVSEVGVVHDTVGDRNDASVIRKGYPAFDRGGTALSEYWPSDDSGSPLNGAVGNLDLSVTGATFGSTGVFDTSEVDYDGADDVAEGSATGGGVFDPQGGGYTITCWVNTDQFGSGDYGAIAGSRDSGGATSHSLKLYKGNSGEFRWRVDNDSAGTAFPQSSFNPSNGTWYFLAGRLDDAAGTADLWVNGSERDSGSIGSVDYPNNVEVVLGADPDSPSQQNYDGRLGEIRYYKRALSDTELTALWDVYNSESTLTTQTKSFSNNQTPDLQNLVYDQSATGESIILDIIGSPGTASEEVVSQTLDGATSYSLTWSNSHVDFRIKPRLSTSEVRNTPTFSKAELVA